VPEWGAVLLPLGLLLAPSIWMLSVIPPLWRDIDAYIQVTQPPGTQTILQYGPLYCLVARIPFYLGYAIDCVRAGNPVPPAAFLLHPTLTDSGVLALLVSQHLALGCSGFCLISVASRLFSVRLLLAGIWAVNPLFYTFAHSVGSEALSVILLLLLGATGIRIISHRRQVPKTEWLLFGLLLWLSILTRHLNALLAMLMPVTFLLLSAHRLIMAAVTRSQLMRRGQRLWARQSLKKAGIALVIGLSCIVLANVSLRGLCYAAHIPCQSQVGFSFLDRLKFVTRLPSETANNFLDQIARDNSATEVKNVITQLREAVQEGSDWESTAFWRKAQSLRSNPEKEFLPALNRAVLAFLWPPRDVFVRAVAADFAKARATTIPNVVRSLFVHTIFYYSHRDAMPGYASLVTFRDKSAEEILSHYKRHKYFYHRKEFSYDVLWCLWLVMISILSVVTKKRSGEMAAVYYGAALTLLGLAMMLANCLLAEFQPRYTLPMWELTIISMTVLFGRGLERWLDSGRKLLGSTEFESPASPSAALRRLPRESDAAIGLRIQRVFSCRKWPMPVQDERDVARTDENRR
jgi:hypothetical protein